MKVRATTLFIALAVCAFWLQACSRQLSPQPSCNFVQNPELQRVSWKSKGLPIKLYLHNSVPPEAYPAFDRAVTQYNDKVGHGKELFKIVARGVSGNLDPEKDGYSTIYWFTAWDPARPTEQARTTIYWAGDEIFEADMRINAANFKYSYGGTVGANEVDLESIAVHELGHALGLAHNSTHGSVMNITLSEGVDRRVIGAVDESSLSCEY